LPEKRRRAATVSDIVVIVNGVRRAVVITAKTSHSGAMRSIELWCAIAHLRISRYISGFRARAPRAPE